MPKFNSILGTVGRTPVAKITRLAPQGIDLYVKVEAFNPLGSVKDRLALGVIEAAEKSGELNLAMHSRTTAREIADDFKGGRLDYWVTGYGTGGTLTGVSRVLRKERPETKIVVCEPSDAALLTSAKGGHFRRHHVRRDLRRRAPGRQESRPRLDHPRDAAGCERYLSTPLFGDAAVEMTEEELAISNSTPGNRLPPKAA